MKVQITVEDELWRRVKSEAALVGATLSDFVYTALTVAVSGKSSPVARKQRVVTSQSIGGVASGRLVEDIPGGQLEEPWHVCQVCRENKAQSEMTYHAKTMKWACNDCVENQKNNQ